MLFSKPNKEQTIALAGTFNCCQLVDNLARDGKTDEHGLEIAINSLFIENPNTTEEVFGGCDNLQKAFKGLNSTISSNAGKNAELLRYLMGVMHLSSKLQKNTAMLDHISKRLKDIDRQRSHFSSLHESVINSLADLYVETIGSFQRRIQVNGYPQHLKQPLVAAKIRCLLFAGLRASVLWSQLGGKKSHLILQRTALQWQLQDLTKQTIP